MNALSLSFKDTNFQITDINGQPWLRGLQVASALGYKNPAADIVNLYNRNADEFTDSMTQVIELPTAGGKQQVRVFSLRGCHLLGMLARTKVAKEFRRWVLDVLEETLLNGKVSDGPAAKTTADDRTPLRQAVAALVGRKGIDYSTAYGMVHQRFGVGAIEDIPAEQLPEAVAYVHALTLHTGLVGEVLDREPLPAPQPALLDGLDIERFAVTVYYGAWALEMLNEVALPLRQLGHPKATTMHTLWAESRGFLRHNVQALRRILPALEPDRAAHVRGSLDRLQRLNARFI